MRVYALVVEMPEELEMMVAPSDCPENSVLKLILDMQSRYTFGVNTQMSHRIMKLLFPKESERDFAYNEIAKSGHDAIRMFHPCSVPDDSFTDKAQERYKKENLKAVKKAKKKIARKMK